MAKNYGCHVEMHPPIAASLSPQLTRTSEEELETGEREPAMEDGENDLRKIPIPSARI